MNDLRIVHPLFSDINDGDLPLSPKLLEVEKMPIKAALLLNNLWHSRLPELTNWGNCHAFGAFYKNIYYAVAIFGPPIARAYNDKGYLELRRMAISNDSPKNTASCILKPIRKIIKKTNPKICKLISYQDTDVHIGTIYKASGWFIGGEKKNIGAGWNTRDRSKMQATGDKIRWEYNL